MKRYIKSSDDRLSRYTIEPIPECDDDETGEHTCWAMKSAYPTYTSSGGERYDYIWISKYGDQEYVVENANGYNLVGEGKSYKTLRGATKKAAEIMWRRDEAGSYQDVQESCSITSSDLLRFEFLVKRYDNDSPEVEVVCAESQREAEDKLNNDGYVEWWDYNKR